MRYVERNPVRARLVNKAQDYQWSSAKAHVLGLKDSLLTDNFMSEEIADWAAYLADEDDKNDLDMFDKHSRTGRALGDDQFITKLEILTGRMLKKGKPGPRAMN
ncbi:MAG: hypothetical protein AAB091_03370 [Elusimicrobiota bacterium]